MKVWLLNRHYYPYIGGVESTVYEMSKAVVALGHEARVITFERPPAAPREEPARVEYIPLESLRGTRLFAIYRRACAARLKRFVDGVPAEERPDCVISKDAMMIDLLRSLLPDVRSVYIAPLSLKSYNRQKPQPQGQSFARRLMRLLSERAEEREQTRAVRGCARMVVHSHSMRRQIAADCGVPEAAIEVLYPGCSIAPGQSETYARGKRLLFVGRLAAEKNVEMLVEAVGLLDDPEAELTIVGDGPRRTAIEAKIRALGLEGRIRMAGASTQVEAYYRQADVLALPSQYEAFGMVVIEAFTCGVPVVGFPTIPGQAITALDELVEDGRTGFLCDAFSARALADGLRRALALPDGQYAQMRRDCLQYARENFSWRTLAERCIGGK